MTRWLASALAALLVGSCAPAPPMSPDLTARVAGEEVSWSEVRSWMASAVGETDEAPEAIVSSQLLDQYVDQLLLERLARDRGFPGDEDADHRELLAFLLSDSGLEGTSETEARAYYAAHRQRWILPERVRLRQILVEDRDLAERAARQIRDGRPFAEVAEELSEEPNAHLGGDQGFLARDDLPPSFVELIFQLEEGEISGIVPAEYGFHLFQVIEKRPAEEQSFGEVAPEIVRILDGRRIDAEIERLVAVARDRYNVTVYRANLPFDYLGSYPTDTD